jgi:virulence-associated protein VagC
MRSLPKLGAELGHVKAIDDPRSAIAYCLELVGREPDVQRDDRLASSTEHFPRKRRIEADGVEVEIRRRAQQRVILPSGKRKELSRRNANDAISDAERGRTAHHEVQLGFVVEMARPLTPDRLRVLPHEGTLPAVGHEPLIERSGLRE